ncbi:hypothetical protein WISP_149686 [Willisornis vidua]|uniref:F5/8 type C domain-containing protein n=1 Tax=Willisornis vidua TaxID=1566151 RepID=A0ABQ9CQ23_9PASS|nr:hypothetical protein WISP_149686 [Willisornis vidua]
MARDLQILSPAAAEEGGELPESEAMLPPNDGAQESSRAQSQCLASRGGAGGWSPSASERYQWLQVDFGSRRQLSAIATQGRYSSSDWVTQYRLLYSDTGRNWKPYHQDGNIWVFPPQTLAQIAQRGCEGAEPHNLQKFLTAL